jgi:glycerol-3-phosphate acyltransferase PlsY
MSAETLIALLSVGSYVIGSVPTGLWLGLALRGIDIRDHGSGNIGATNTFRVLGARIGGAAFVCDLAKGLVPVLVARALDTGIYTALACGVAAILGHLFSMFLRFRGGKGVATSTGVFLGLAPWATLLAAVVFGIVFWRTRIVSVASFIAAAALTLGVFLLPLVPGVSIAPPVQWVATAVALLIVWKHRANIRRLLKGAENKF